MSLIEKFKPLLNISNLSEKTTSQKTDSQPQNAPLDVGTSGLNEVSYRGLMTKSFLNKTFDAVPQRIGTEKSDSPTPQPVHVSPYEALQQIEELPPPNRNGISPQLPDEDKQAIYDARVREYNERRIAIADNTILNSTPPSRDDYKNLPRGIAEIEYRDALSAYHQNIAELKTISREAKQANLEINPEFKKLSPENQALLKEKMTANEGDVGAVDILVQLGESPGFNQLSAEEQTRLINLVGGTNEQLSVPARNALASILNDPNADLSNPETFRNFLRDQPGLQFVVSQNIEEGEFDSRRQPYTVTGPEEVENYDFHSGTEDALKYEVEVNGETIPVYVAANQDPNETYHTIEQVAMGLAALPQASFDRIDSVRIEPHQNPDDAYWAQQYNQPGFRSYMTAGADGDVSIYPTTGDTQQQVLDGSLIHETGHILSGQEFGNAEWAAWETAMSEDGISPSVYARSSREEDFSETLELYMLVRGTPQEAEIRAIMPERFAILDELVGG